MKKSNIPTLSLLFALPLGAGNPYNRSMRAITIPTLLTALILFRSASAYGASIGATFLGNTGDRNVESWRLAPADSAGVIAQTNWNNLQWDDWGNIGAPPGGFVGVSDPLLDSAGISRRCSFGLIAMTPGTATARLTPPTIHWHPTGDKRRA